MKMYAATFVAGTQEIVIRRLKQFPLEHLKITYSDDSFVAFRSSMPETKIANLRFFNNIFAVLAENKSNTSLDQFLESTLANATSSPILSDKRFRLSVADKEGLQNINPQLRKKLTEAISTKYNMTESAHRPDVEFWFLQRSSGFGIFGWKLPHVQFKHTNRRAGSLRPELAHILGLVANLGSRDRVLDPFAGSGVILEEALAGFHVRQSVGVEKDKRLLAELKKKPGLEVIEGNATNLAVRDDSIDKVITDPPWGEFQQIDKVKLSNLYIKSLQETARVLKKGGVAVILSGAEELIKHAVIQTAELKLIKSYPILVSGHKATIYKFRKN